MDGADRDPKPATPARMYDYYLGGIHNFPADQEAARRVIELFPEVPIVARANRAFLRRAVRYLARAGIRQFLDIGSGIPTQGNVHEIAQRDAPGSRVVYVDIDPVAVAESLEILTGNPDATAVRGDLRNPGEILEHPAVRTVVNLEEPTAVLLAAVLPFIPDDDRAQSVTEQLVAAVAPGSYLAISQGAAESFAPSASRTVGEAVYKRQTGTPPRPRSRAQMERFFAGLELVDPGVTWASAWRPVPRDDDDPCADDPGRSSSWAGVGRKR
jgi:hypothetical protein